ncbi:MAG: HAMP domain-containing histidine kinase [Alphaproteobacteria bacterium]|nr:HAMP domain-containing histidine kinase [Alphaproteobacteria bacterium]
MFNRLFVKVYLTIVAVLLLVVVVSALFFRAGPEADQARGAFQMAGGVLTASLADTAAPAEAQRAAVQRLSQLINADLALYTADGKLIASAGDPLPPPRDVTNDDNDDRWIRHGRRHVWTLPLADGRLVVVRPPFERGRRGLGFFSHLALMAILIALAAYPVVRGITGRLERLQKGVEQLGAGDLTTRVKVEGKDEVAGVAESFNRAAGRIEELIKAHKMLLANASHELRTPLTRLRMGIELLKEKVDPARKAELEQDIAELDQLIDEILLSSRLDAMDRLDQIEPVDLLALAAEEAAHYEDTNVTGSAVTVQGDARLLRRLIRNLLENARRHGAPPIEVAVTIQTGAAVLTVSDHGPGIADADRARIFEPFFRKAGAASTGTGLGLALVRQIARRHGGDVTVETRDGRAAFVLRLPL